MKMIIKIARMELQKMFYSPIAWLVLVIFAIQSGLSFVPFIKNFMMAGELGYDTAELTTRIFTGGSGFFTQIQRSIYLYIPLLTMGLLSREYGSGSIKLLYSSPISNQQIILGKFLSMMVFGFAMILILLLESLYGFVGIKDYDFPLVLSGLLGLYLLICTYSAIGLFMSSLTSYQVVAAMGTFATFFVLEKVGRMWQGIELVRDITYWLSISGRSNSFIYGLISSENVLYFIFVPALFILFSIFRLKAIREKSPGYISFIRYAGTFIIIALFGYLSTVPFLMSYYDSTRTKDNTLTTNSQEIISKLKGKVEITTYVNIFGNNAYAGFPRSVNNDLGRFKQYRRFKPDIKMKYKYYYNLPLQQNLLDSHNRRFAGLTIEEALSKAAKSYDLKEELFKPGKDYLDEIDLASELNRFVRKITTEDGKSVYLRTFDDMIRFAQESQKTAAFKKLVEDLPIVGFIKGHDERNVNDFGSRGYFSLAKEKPFRYSLINNGFDFVECGLGSPVDEKINILVIAEPKTEFSAQEINNLNEYINRGGNLIIAGDRNRQDNINPLIEQLGVTFLPGQAVEFNKGYGMDLITAVFTEEGKELTFHFVEVAKNNLCVTMPGAVAISYKNKGDFNYIPVLVSDAVKDIQQIDSIGSWNERRTTDFIDDVAKYNPEEDDTPGPITTALALTRKLGGKEQRILILGDADCFSNSELSRRRNEINASNFGMSTGMFYWLSNDEVPIDVRRPEHPDNKILTKGSQINYLNAGYKIILPALLALAFLIIWLRRKGR